MPFAFSQRSLDRLATVHPALQKVMNRAIKITDVDFGITEGKRTLARQRQLVAAGASRTMNSRHLSGRAVDVAAYVGRNVRWDWPLYERIAKAVKAASKELGIPIIWGGDWKSFRDGPHFELTSATPEQ